jgi:hypothetical protein
MAEDAMVLDLLADDALAAWRGAPTVAEPPSASAAAPVGAEPIEAATAATAPDETAPLQAAPLQAVAAETAPEAEPMTADTPAANAAPATAAPADGAPPAQTPVDPAPAAMPEPAAVVDVTALRAENQQLAEQLTQLAARMSGEARTKPAAPPAPDTAPDTAPSAGGLIAPGEYEALLAHPETFARIAERIQQRTREEILRELPRTIHAQVAHQVHVNQLAHDFFKANQDLLPHLDYVTFVGAQIEARHPDWSYEQVLSETEQATRAGLNLAKKPLMAAPPAPAGEGRRPAFARPSGGRVPEPTPLSAREQMIADLIN